MSTTIVQYGDAVEFTITVTENGTAKDISTATTLQIVFRSPSRTTTTKTATFSTDGTDGKITCTTATTDLTTKGLWRVQGVVDNLHTRKGTFMVESNL